MLDVHADTFSSDPRATTVFRRSVQDCFEDIQLTDIVIEEVRNVAIPLVRVNPAVHQINLLSSIIPGIQITYNLTFQPQYVTGEANYTAAYPIVASLIKSRISSGQFNTSIQYYSKVYQSSTFGAAAPSIVDFNILLSQVLAIVHSAKPTSRPTGQPSSYPSFSPSCQPSSQPTSSPSHSPSSQPSSSPTSQPTFTIETMWMQYVASLVQNSGQNSSLLKFLGHQEQRLTYTELDVNSNRLFGNCDTWERFRFLHLGNSVTSFRLNSITLFRKGTLLADPILNISCNSEADVNEIVKMLHRPFTQLHNFSWQCDENIWRVNVCPYTIEISTSTNRTYSKSFLAPSLCVNCNNPCNDFTCDRQSLGPNSIVLASCQYKYRGERNCGSLGGMLTLVNIKYTDLREVVVAPIPISSATFFVSLIILVGFMNFYYHGALGGTKTNNQPSKSVSIVPVVSGNNGSEITRDSLASPHTLAPMIEMSSTNLSNISLFGFNDLQVTNQSLPSIASATQELFMKENSNRTVKATHALFLKHLTVSVRQWYEKYPLPSKETLLDMSCIKFAVWELRRCCLFLSEYGICAHWIWSPLWMKDTSQKDRWLTALRLSCKIACTMVFVAVFVFIQYPVDDGSCSQWSDEVSCLSRNLGLLLPYGRSYCSWIPLLSEQYDSSSILQELRRDNAEALQASCVWTLREMTAYDAVFVIALSLACLMVQEVVIGQWIFEGLLPVSQRPLSAMYFPRQMSQQSNQPHSASSFRRTSVVPFSRERQIVPPQQSRISPKEVKNQQRLPRKKKRNQVSVLDPDSGQPMTVTIGFDELSVDDGEGKSVNASPFTPSRSKLVDAHQRSTPNRHVGSSQVELRRPQSISQIRSELSSVESHGRKPRSVSAAEHRQLVADLGSGNLSPYGSRTTTASRQSRRGGFGSTMTPFRDLFAQSKLPQTICLASDPLALKLTVDELFVQFIKRLHKRRILLNRSYQSGSLGQASRPELRNNGSIVEASSVEVAEFLREKWLNLFQTVWQQYSPGILQYRDTVEDLLNDEDIELSSQRSVFYCLNEALLHRFHWLFQHPHSAPHLSIVNHNQQMHPRRTTWRQFVKYEIQEVLETALGLADNIQSEILSQDILVSKEHNVTETSLVLWQLFLIDILGRHSRYAILFRMMTENILQFVVSNDTKHRYPWALSKRYDFLSSELAQWTVYVVLLVLCCCCILVTCLLLQQHTDSHLLEWLYCCLAVFWIETIFIFGWISIEENWLLPVVCMPIIQSLHTFVAQRVFHVQRFTPDDSLMDSSVLQPAQLPPVSTIQDLLFARSLDPTFPHPLDGMVSIRPGTTSAFPSRVQTATEISPTSPNRERNSMSPTRAQAQPSKPEHYVSPLLFAAQAFVSTQVAEILDLNSHVLKQSLESTTSETANLNILIDPFAGMPLSSRLNGVRSLNMFSLSTRSVIDTIIEFAKNSIFPETIGSHQWPGNLPHANDFIDSGMTQPTNTHIIPPISCPFRLERLFVYYVTTLQVSSRRCVPYIMVVSIWLMLYHLIVVGPKHASQWALFGGLVALITLCLSQFAFYRYTRDNRNLWWPHSDTQWLQFLISETSDSRSMFMFSNWSHIREHFDPVLYFKMSTSHNNKQGLENDVKSFDPSIYELSDSSDGEDATRQSNL